MTTERPFKLGTEPILEVIAEIRLNVPEDAAPMAIGRFFQPIAGAFPNLEALPPNGIPIDVRSRTEQLRYSALYRASDGVGSSVLIGDRSVAYISERYGGWEDFKGRAFPVLEEILGLFAAPVQRVAVRYVNLLPGGLVQEQLDMSALRISIGDRPIANPSSVQLRTEFVNDGAIVVLQMTTNAVAEREGAPARSGVILDIDTIENVELQTWAEVANALEHVHAIERDVFFSLLSDTALAQFTPIYGGGSK